MKKVLSLLLICTMILSFAAMTVVNAAGEGYTLVAGKVTQIENEDTGDMETVFTADSYNEVACGSILESTQVISLQVTTNTAVSGGYIAIDYDETKVMPVRYNSSFSKVFESFNDTSNYTNFATAGTGVTTTASTAATYPDRDLGAVVYTWTGSISAGSTVAYIHFACVDGVTTDNFDENTFKIATDTTILNKYLLTSGGAYLEDTSSKYSVADSTTLTYPNSEPVEKDVIGDVAESLPTDNASGEYGEDYSSTINFGTVEGVEDYAPVAQAVVFGKAVQDLTSNTYGIKVGDTKYPGLLDVTAGKYWSIILTTNDASLLADKTYNIYYTKDGVADTLHYSEAKSLPVVNAQ